MATFEVEADGAPRSIVVEADEDRIRLGMGRSWRTYHRDMSRGSIDLDMSVGGRPLRLSVERDGAIRLMLDGAEVEPSSLKRVRRSNVDWGRGLRKVQVFTGATLFLCALAVFGAAVAAALGHSVLGLKLGLDRVFLGAVIASLVLSARVAMGGRLSAFVLLNVTATDLTVRAGLYRDALHQLRSLRSLPFALPDLASWPCLSPAWLNLSLVVAGTLYSVLLLICMLRPNR
ncbi:MAG: hypothetical protein U1E76_27500 [Planctomycetota bacterium]